MDMRRILYTIFARYFFLESCSCWMRGWLLVALFISFDNKEDNYL